MRKLLRFVGREVAAKLALGTVVGVIMFAVELAFAYGLQAFLLALGVLQTAAVSLPVWVPQKDISAVLAFILAAGVAKGGMNWLQVYMPAAVQEQFRNVQRGRILHWALHSETVSTHQATMLFNEWTDNCASLIYSLQSLAVQVTSALMLTVALLALSAKLSLILGGVLALLYFPIRRADRKILVTSHELGRAIEDTTRRLVVSIRNLLLIQIYGTQDLEERRAQASLEVYGSKALYYHRVTASKFVLPQIVGTALICLITIAARGSFRAAPGVLVSYFYLVIRLLQLLSTVNASVSSMIRGWPHAQIVWRWWQEQEGASGGAVPHAAAANGSGPVGWRLSEVSFRYPKTEIPVVRGLSLDLAPGQCLVVTGPSGAGKSTVLNLLLGGLRPDTGSVEVLSSDGSRTPLSEFRPKLFPLIGYVGPESLLIEGTIRENLLYGLGREPGADEFAVALGKAECSFVSELKEGLDYRITEQGQGLSAGQKQRLSLARAFLRKPKVLILDEATSNLDQETEKRLVETLSRVKGEMTIVAATHREALLKIADRRLSLD